MDRIHTGIDKFTSPQAYLVDRSNMTATEQASVGNYPIKSALENINARLLDLCEDVSKDLSRLETISNKVLGTADAEKAVGAAGARALGSGDIDSINHTISDLVVLIRRLDTTVARLEHL